MHDNKSAYSYLVDSTSYALHLRTTQRPYGTAGRVSANSTDGPGELPLLAFPLAPFSARGLPPSVASAAARGLAEGCRVAAGSSGTILCVPTEDFLLAAAKQSSFSTKVVEYLPVSEDSVMRTAAGHRGLHPHLTAPA
jgi:hypothetical protein